MARSLKQKHQFRDKVLDRLNAFTQVTARGMFGGYGLYRDGVMFAFIADEALYFKVDEGNREDFIAAEMEPFTYWRSDRRISLSYYRLPDDVFAQIDVLSAWLDKAYAAGCRAKKKTKKRTPARTMLSLD